MRVAPARTRARPWACTRTSVPWSYLHGYAHGHGHTFTGTRTAMVTCLLREHSRGDQRGRFERIYTPTPAHSNPLRRRGGMGVRVRHRFAMRRRRRRSGGSALKPRLKAGCYGPPKGGLVRPASSGLLRMAIPSALNLPANNGYRHQACGMWPVPDSCFPVLKVPPNKRVPASTSTTARIASRINLWSGFTEKICGDRPAGLVEGVVDGLA